MKIVLEDHPDRHDVKKEDIDMSIEPYEVSYTTEITLSFDDPNKFDIDVYAQVGVFKIKCPKLSRAGVDRLEMWIACMESTPDTIEWIKNIMSEEDAAYVVKNYYSMDREGRLRT